jgi:hypothetical protein
MESWDETAMARFRTIHRDEGPIVEGFPCLLAIKTKATFHLKYITIILRRPPNPYQTPEFTI